MEFNGTAPVDPDYPDVDQGSCQLLGPTALVSSSALELVPVAYRSLPGRSSTYGRVCAVLSRL